MEKQLSCASKDDYIVRNLPLIKITYNLHIVTSVGLQWVVKRKDDRVWSLVMSNSSPKQGKIVSSWIIHHFVSF